MDVLMDQIHILEPLVQELKDAGSLDAKLNILQRRTLSPITLSLINSLGFSLSQEEKYALFSIDLIGQATHIFKQHMVEEDLDVLVKDLLSHLVALEQFYAFAGGIAGYQLALLKLLVGQQVCSESCSENHCYVPKGLNLEAESPEVRQAVRWGIASLEKMAEIYPVGGAADRLNLIDETCGSPLPAACLRFCGRTLLEGLIHDLQAREALYFKLFGKQLCTPIVLMTSEEKANHSHIVEICEENNWFGRPKESFRFLIQPSVPVVTHEGVWSCTGPLKPFLKPGGHGVIWKLAQDDGVFDWLIAQGRTHCLIRQINNPVLGFGNTLLALAGVGCHQNKAFGFVTTERVLKSAEGIDVLVEKPEGTGFAYGITNIEYTAFKHLSIGEMPAHEGSPYSLYPANTNILFAEIKSIQEALKVCPIPGQLINMKKSVPQMDAHGNIQQVPGGRLESTMQNIADVMTEFFEAKQNPEEVQSQLKTFTVHNTRSKTLSTTKNLYEPGGSPLSTPEQAFFDLQQNFYEVLTALCGMSLPPKQSFEESILHGPSALILLHPAFGPTEEVVGQKIRGGRLVPGAELRVEIDEARLINVVVEGSLIITGKSDSRCLLKDVVIHNRGIYQDRAKKFWQDRLSRTESVQIILEKDAEFTAEGITLHGTHVFHVPKGHRLYVKDGQHVLEPITAPSWTWRYAFAEDDRVVLTIMD